MMNNFEQDNLKKYLEEKAKQTREKDIDNIYLLF